LKLPDNICCVVFAIDSGAPLFGLVVAIDGIVKHLRPGWQAKIKVIDLGIKPSLQRRLLKWASARQILIDIVDGGSLPLEGLSSRGHLSVATYARLFLADLLPNISRMIYLDADLVVARDLVELWETDLKGMAIGAVPDYDDILLADSPALRYASSEFADKSDKCFNAGVLLLDLDKWRASRVAETLLGFSKRYADQTVLCDQDALNVCLSGQYYHLEKGWNARSAFFTRKAPFEWVYDSLPRQLRDASLTGPAIYHFAGPYKPWNGGVRHPCLRSYAIELWKSRWMHWWEWPGYAASALLPPFLRRMLESQ